MGIKAAITVKRLAKEYDIPQDKAAKALAAVDRILEHLNESDFAAHAGINALKELVKYRVDMAIDIAKTI